MLRIFFVLAFLTSFVATCLANEEAPIVDCQSQACLKIATEQPWPIQGLNNTFIFNYGLLRIALPRDFSSMSATDSSGKIIIAFEDGAQLHIDTETEHDYAETMDFDFSQSQFHITDKARIVYLQSPRTIPPASKNDLAFWKRHIEDKQALFSETSRLTVSRKPGLTAYYSDDRPQWWTAQASIVLDQISDRVYVLTLWGKDFQFLTRVIAGVQQKQ